MKNADVDMIQRLSRSNLYTEFKQAFGASVGLPLTLRPAEFWLLAHRSQPYENPFCAMIAQTNRGCAACLEAEQRAVDAAQDRSATVRCFADLRHTAVPVKLGERTIGFLLTGQIALDLPSPARFEAIVRQLTEWGVSMDRNRLEEAYYRIPGAFVGPIRWSHPSFGNLWPTAFRHGKSNDGAGYGSRTAAGSPGARVYRWAPGRSYRSG